MTQLFTLLYEFGMVTRRYATTIGYRGAISTQFFMLKDSYQCVQNLLIYGRSKLTSIYQLFLKMLKLSRLLILDTTNICEWEQKLVGDRVLSVAVIWRPKWPESVIFYW